MKIKKTQSTALKAPRISFQEIGQTIYIRIFFQGKETKFSTNIINVKGEKLDTKTGIIKGDSEATKLLITYRDRMTSFYEKSLESNKRIDIKAIKMATLGSSITAQIPNLFEAIDRWFDYKYHKDSGLNRWTIEKNGYIVDNIKTFLKKEYKDYLIPLEEVELIIADKLINYLKNDRGNQHDHAVRHAKALKSVFAFALDCGWIQNNKFANQTYKRGSKNEIHYLTEKEIKQMIELTLYNPTLQLARDLYIFSCYTGLSYADVMNLKASDIKSYEKDLYFISKARIKGLENNSMKKKVFYAPILPEAEVILKKYEEISRISPSGLYFPRVSNQQINRTIKEIALLANIENLKK